MEITISTEIDNDQLMKYTSLFEVIAKRISEKLNLTDQLTCSVVFVDDEIIRVINRDYRNIDKATDVISFALKDSVDNFQTISEIDNELGDIIISVDAVIRQAKEYGHSEKRETVFLFTHGLLHLLGYDHIDESGEEVMFAFQREILDGVV